jgi:cytochrome c oxidase assembly factor CtaG
MAALSLPVVSAEQMASIHWHLDDWVAWLLFATGVIYLTGVFRLWRNSKIGRGVSWTNVFLFLAGWILLLAAISSPLEDLADRLFSVHMITHELIMAAAAPLLSLSRPLAPFAWSLPRSMRRHLGQLRGIAILWNTMTAPLAATIMHGIAIWIWHIPALFLLAVAHEPVHWLQHFSFFASAVLFWQAMLRVPVAGAAIGYLFITSLHTSLLGALLVLSPRVWFPIAGNLELSALEDQQLGGLIMWVLGGLVYAAAALMIAAQWISRRRPAIRCY